MKRFNLIGLMSVICLALSGAASAADNRQHFNGSACDRSFGAPGDFNDQVNGIRNTTAGYRNIVCPLTVDETVVLNGTYFVRTHVTGAGNFYCYLYSLRGDGTPLQVTFGNRIGTGWFGFPNITMDHPMGTYSMYCRIPPGGTLNTILMGEIG